MLLLTIAGAVQTWLLFALAVLAGVGALLALVGVLRKRPPADETAAPEDEGAQHEGEE